MDYEFRIVVAERELAHLREMQQLTRSHLDAHDRSVEAALQRFERIEGYLEQTAQAQARTEANLAHMDAQLARTDALLAELAGKFNGLIDALVKEHGNGR